MTRDESRSEQPSDRPSQPIILVVDDNPAMAQLIQNFVQLAGFQTEIAYSGLEGLDKARAGMPDLILVDLQMAGMDGWELYQGLREFSSIPVVFVTSHASEENIARAQEMGAAAMISKDRGPGELTRQIQLILEENIVPGQNAMPEQDTLH